MLNSYFDNVRRLSQTALVLAAAAVAVPALGLDIKVGDTTIHASGFVSQAVIYSNKNNYFGESENQANFDYRELGGVFSANFTPKLSLSSQILSRKAGSNDDGSLTVDHLFLNYKFYSDNDTSISARAGRMKSAFGWYNETRDVPFTRPSIFLSQAVYQDRVRNTFYFEDGVRINGEHQFDLNTLSWHVGYGEPRVDSDELSDAAPLAGSKVSTGTGERTVNAGLVYDYDAGRARVGISVESKIYDVEFTNDVVTIDGNEFPELGAPPMSIDIYIQDMELRNDKLALSFEYNSESWSFVAERVFTQTEIDAAYTIVGAPADGALNFKFNPDAYYLQFTYRLTGAVEVFARYDVFYSDGDDHDGPGELANFNFSNSADHEFYSKDVTIGSGWFATPQLLFRGELHVIEGTNWLNTGDNPPGSSSQYWHMLVLQASYRF